MAWRLAPPGSALHRLPLARSHAGAVAGRAASWRHALWSRWPTATPPEPWPDAAAYDTAVRRLIARGAAIDEPNVYFLARLSPRYPTVEVRVADVCLDAGTAVLAAGLTRALVATARHGLAGPGIDPVTGQPAGARVLRARLLEHVRPALSDHGDTETITGLLDRLDDQGTGADRQRALFTRGLSTPAFITALARATLSGCEPGRQRPGYPGPGSGRRAAVSRRHDEQPEA